MKLLLIPLTIILFASCSSTQIEMPANAKVVLASDVKWTYLNPKRKDKAPMAGTLWGNRNGNDATGFILRPKDGFESPPHIHNVSYRGVVIQGLLHNDDPKAAEMWMPAGSFWTQPKGEIHITAAKGSNPMAYIEIEKGPYLVQPSKQAFDSGERPVNVDKGNIVWQDSSNLKWLKTENNSAKIAFLWGTPNKSMLNGSLVKLPAGFKGEIRTSSKSFRAVVIKGELAYYGKDLVPGSLLESKGKALHHVSSKDGEETILYIRTEGKFKIK